jgi:hypothetical protein
MPRGVTDQFLKILDNERRSSVRTVAAMGALAVFAYFMAELTDEPLLGAVVWLALGALVAGIAAGGVLAWRRTETYNASIREAWNQWMRMSLSCSRVDEVARHVHEKGRRAPLAGVAWSALFLANALLFAALWLEASWALTLGVVVTAANGLVLGALLGHALWNLRWSSQFHRALDDLMANGQLGVWGEI